MRQVTAGWAIWALRCLICVALAFAVVWGEVVINAAMGRTPEVYYKVNVHHIEHLGEGDCRIVPVVKKTGDPPLIYHGFESCDTIQKGDYLRLPDPAEYPPDE